MLKVMSAQQSALLIVAVCNMVRPAKQMSTRLEERLVAELAPALHEQHCGDGATWHGRALKPQLCHC